jgi:hypothetical protein
MAIAVTCPNGHVLKVKDEFAGKLGRCPHCQAKVQVPTPVAVISDDDILAVLGPSGAGRRSGDSSLELELSDSGALHRKAICPECGGKTSIAFTHCPRCGSPLTATTAHKPR